MLLDRSSGTQNFSDLDDSEDRVSPAPPRPGARPHQSLSERDVIQPGDEVVFARLDLAEALGIWRHATGRVTGVHDEGQASLDDTITVDVQFEGHDTLQRYLPDLFEKRVH